jgi:predicted PurR-regulated permease PerM
MVILGVSTWIMLALLGVPQALILALISGGVTFVPYLGPLIALVPILLVAFLESPLLALYVFILYMVIQNVESNVIMPIVFHRTAQIPPALDVVSQILFGSLLGFLGFLLAVPLMAVILQSVKMIYVEDILGDRSLNDDT